MVCSEAGGNPEAVTHGEDGFVYPVGHTESLAEMVRTLADDPELRKKMGKLAKRNAESEFGMARMVEAHQSLYRRILVRYVGRADHQTSRESVG